MAFAQQRRRPNTQQRRLNYETSTEDLRQVTNADANTDTNIVLSPTARLSSDSDTDWHVISASSQHRRPVHIRTSSSPTFDPSEPESLVSFRASDTESFSDLDIHHSDQSSPQFSTLPAHDGTGTFTDALSDEDSSSPSGFAQVVKKSMLRSDKGKQHDSTWRAQIADFEPDSASMPNILLPHGGINVPSFANPAELQQTRTNASSDSVPAFAPTLHNVPLSDQNDSDATTHTIHTVTTASATDTDSPVRLAHRRRHNLDSIPSHHPSIPGAMTSTAILSTIWEHVRRLTSDFLENDANTSETLSNLMSEAARDGCMPFGSHLHMDFGSPFLSSRKHMEGTW